MEVFATFDIINERGEKVAEGHKASFCLEDNQCLEGVEPQYACANYGDQGAMNFNLIKGVDTLTKGDVLQYKYCSELTYI